MFHANLFAYAAIESITEPIRQTAVAGTLTAARWAVLGYDFLACDNAKQTYRWVKDMSVALGQLAFWSVVWVYAKVQQWADAEVAAALPPAVDPFDPSVNPLEVEPIVEGCPVVSWTMPAAMAPVPTLTVPVAHQDMTTDQLRKACIAYNKQFPVGDIRRIKRAGHLTKAEALVALAKV